MRILFVVPPFVGHVNPTIAVGSALRTRGHQVAWLGHAPTLAQTLPTGYERLAFDDATVDRARERAEVDGRKLRGLASLPFLFEEVLVPLARATFGLARAAVEAWKPDVLVVDQQMLSGALVARRLGLAWASFVCTPAYGMVDPFVESPKIGQWVAEQLAVLEREYDLAASAHPDLSPELVIVATVRELSLEPCVPNVHFIGASGTARPEAVAFPWERLQPGRRVYLSLGTINAEQGPRLYRAAVEGLRELPLQLIVSAPPELVVDAPAHWIVAARVPQLAVLEHVDAIVTHGGLNTVNEALANALPMVVAPIRDDQPKIADALERAGVGVRIHLGRVTAASLRAALLRVLDEPSFRENARRVQTALATAGGPERAAELIERVPSAAHAPARGG
jgi:MGT family glycosyltransferase